MAGGLLRSKHGLHLLGKVAGEYRPASAPSIPRRVNEDASLLNLRGSRSDVSDRRLGIVPLQFAQIIHPHAIQPGDHIAGT